MKKIVIEISHPPYGHENAYSGFFVALGSLPKGVDTIVILTGEGVYAARRGQVDPPKNINLPSTEEQVNDIINLGGRVIADKQALLVRGIHDEELIEGIEVLNPNEIQDIILNHGEHILTF
ncbi:MAG: DsrE family protein [Halobacteria archaeon]